MRLFVLSGIVCVGVLLRVDGAEESTTVPRPAPPAPAPAAGEAPAAPVNPAVGEKPVDPGAPAVPATPAAGEAPAAPSAPAAPANPAAGEKPVAPGTPAVPATPAVSAAPATPAAGETPAAPDATAAAVQDSASPAAANDQIAINFSGTSLKEVIRVFEQYSNKRFLFEDSVVGKRQVFLLSSEPIPAAYLDDVFESILEIHGLTLVRSGDPKAEIYKIVEIKGVVGKATPTFTAKTLAEAPTGDRVITLLFQLKFMLADQIAVACKSMTSVPEGIIAIPGTNLVRVTDYATNVRRIGALLEELDKTGPKFMRETIKLKFADPTELVNEIQPILNIENRVFVAELERQAEFRMQQMLGRREGQPEGQGQRRTSSLNLQSAMTVAAVPRLGSVIIAATEEKIGDLRKLIETLDIQDPDDKIVEYYPLKYQNPTRLARTLTTIFDTASMRERPGGGERQGGERQGQGEGAQAARTGQGRLAKSFAIVADDDANRIVIVAPRRVHDEVKPIIERLDTVADQEERELRYFSVKNADLPSVAATIARVFGLTVGDDARVARWMQRRAEEGGEGRPRLQAKAGTTGVYTEDLIIADQNLGALIVIAKKDALEKIGAMITQLDVVGPLDKTIENYALKYAKPDEIANAITSLFGAGRGRRRGPEGGGGGEGERAVVVVPNEKLGTLMVMADRETHAEIKKVLSNLDVEGAVLELKYYPVAHANLTELAQTIGRLFNLPLGSDSAQGRRFAWMREGGRQQAMKSGVSEEPVLIADQNMNTLIVLAEKKTHELVAAALARLDAEGAGERVIEYYQLKFAHPASVAEQLTQLFSGTGRRGAGRRYRPWEGGGDYEGLEGGARTQGQIVAVPDEKLGTVMVQADRETHAEIKKVLANLDVEGAVLELKYYPVKHVDLTELAQTIGRLFKLPVGTEGTRTRRSEYSPWGEYGGEWGGGRQDSTRRQARGGLSEEPAVIPDRNLGALIVLAEKKTHELIAPALEQLDVEGPGERETRYYKLQHASATKIVSTLQSLFASGRSSRRQQSWSPWESSYSPWSSYEDGYSGYGRDRSSSSTATAEPIFVADEELATVVVSASPVVHEQIAKVVTQLDIEGPSEKKIEYYRLSFAKPQDIVQTLTSLYPAARAQTSYSPWQSERQSTRTGIDRSVAAVANEPMNTVIVLAVEEVQKEVKDIVKNLDVETATLELKYYSLAHANLDELAQTVSRIFQLQVGTDTAQLRGGGAPVRGRGQGPGAGQGGGVASEPVLIPDRNLNALIVLAERTTQERVAAAIQKLDVQGPGERVTRFYRIANTSVAELASTLTTVFDETRAGTRVGGRPGMGRQGRGQPTTGRTAGIEDAIVVPNEELSMIVVSASEELQKEIAQVVENLDVPSVKDNTLKYYKIENSELGDIADTVAKLFGLTKSEDRTAVAPRRPAMGGGGARTAQGEQRSAYTDERIVLVDYNLGSLLIVAPEEVQTEIKVVIEKIDSMGPGRREIKHYRVPRQNVREIASTIASIFDLELTSAVPRTGAMSRTGTAAAREAAKSLVIPNETLGAVIVVAPADIQKRVADVVQGLETIGPDENELQYYTITKADLIESANMISQIFGIPLGSVEQTFRPRAQQGSTNLLTKERVVIANENLNTLLVVAPRDMQKEIADTVKRIDTVGPRDNVFKMYEVTVSEVTTAAQTISQLFDLKLLQGGATAARTRTTTTPSGPKLTTEPFIMPDEEIGALIINAPEDIHKEIGQVLEKLVTIGRQEKMSIRFYRLKNTSPDEVAVKIGNLFNITVGDSTTALRRTSAPTAGGTTTTTTAYTPPRTTRATTSRSASAARRGRFTADEEENERAAPPAPAESQPQAQATPSTAGGGRSPTRKEFYFEGESVVIPDTNLSSIILIAPEYIHEEVKTVLQTLDVRRPQVLFEVAILDVKNDGQLNIGTEWTTIDRQGTPKARGSGFTNFGVGERSSSANAGFPDVTKVPTDAAGLFVGITKGEIGNVPLLIHMLEQTTDVNIRSTPLLLVNDNQEASFSSLQEEPTTTTSQGTSTTKISFGGFVEAGTVLKITPHVSEGNYIRVDIDLKADNFYGESLEAGIPPPRASNQLVTSITVPDSRTVVIGGLTTTKRSKVVRGWPLLGRIPWLGYLFSSTSEEDITTRLFLFVKPQILDDVDFKDLNRISVGKSFEVQELTGEEIVAKTEEEAARKKNEEKEKERAARGLESLGKEPAPEKAVVPVKDLSPVKDAPAAEKTDAPPPERRETVPAPPPAAATPEPAPPAAAPAEAEGS